MKQTWIDTPKNDILYIILPPFITILIVIIFKSYLIQFQDIFSFYTWLMIIVFIDVAHVYSTLYKTYFVDEEFKKRKTLLIFLPIICFIIGLILFALGSKIFWSVLAYIAVFHFIRQQYGFVRLYSIKEATYKYNKLIDSIIIYTSTLYPMVYWFSSKDRTFNWFIKNEFISINNTNLLTYFKYIYYLVLLIYFFRILYLLFHFKYFNLPKNLIILSTYLSWYLGIIYFNNDLIFTLLNVISHGVPYMALIYLNEIKKNSNISFRLFSYKSPLFSFIIVLMLFSFSEEFLWEILVWEENFKFNLDFENWHIILVPLLTVPQLTHYILDGFIWKRKKS